MCNLSLVSRLYRFQQDVFQPHGSVSYLLTITTASPAAVSTPPAHAQKGPAHKSEKNKCKAQLYWYQSFFHQDISPQGWHNSPQLGMWKRGPVSTVHFRKFPLVSLCLAMPSVKFSMGSCSVHFSFSVDPACWKSVWWNWLPRLWKYKQPWEPRMWNKIASLPHRFLPLTPLLVAFMIYGHPQSQTTLLSQGHYTLTYSK